MNAAAPRSHGPSAFLETQPGVRRLRLAGERSPSPLALAGGTPRLEAMASLPRGTWPIPAPGVGEEKVNGRRHLSLPLAEGEEIYGLGLTFHGLVQTGRMMELRPDHWHHRDDGGTHAPLPFYVSSLGYGVILDTSRRVDVWIGRSHRADAPPPNQDRTEPGWNAVLPGSSVDFFVDEVECELIVLEGPTMLDVVRRYHLLCGGGAMPPKWGLGFWHRMHLKAGEKECRETIDGYRAHGLPLAVLGLEPGWHSNCYPTSHEWRPSLYPDPAGFLGRLADEGLRVNLWQNLFLPADAPIGKAVDGLVASHVGTWGGVVPDLTIPAARDAIKKHLREKLVDGGVSGFKLDEVEDPQWLFPRFAKMPSGHTADEVHALLGLAVQKLTAEAFREKGLRTWGLVRGSHLGSAGMPSVLYNDAYEHESFLTALCSASFGGLLWTPEVRDSADPEDWLRRFQAVCFSPLAMLDAWASSRMPWSHPSVAEGVKEAVLLRHRLLPYLYAAYVRAHREGVPAFRAMHLEPGFEAPKSKPGTAETHGTTNPYARPKALEVKDQWMCGSDLLVAPFFAGKETRVVHLPPGRWHDFHTGAFAGEGRLEIASDLGPIPLFVREGSVIPLLSEEKDPWGDVATRFAFDDLEVRHYGAKPGSFTLYDDDGVTFDFETKGFEETKLEVDAKGAGNAKGARVPRKISYRNMGA